MVHVNILDREDPGILEALACHKLSGQFFPVVRDGQIAAFVSRFAVERVQIPTPLTVADYVAGMEALGFHFVVWRRPDECDALLISEPGGDIREPWHAYANRLRAAFDPWRHIPETTAYLTREA